MTTPMNTRDALFCALNALIKMRPLDTADLAAHARIIEMLKQKGEFNNAYPGCTNLTAAIDTFIDG